MLHIAVMQGGQLRFMVRADNEMPSLGRRTPGWKACSAYRCLRISWTSTRFESFWFGKTANMCAKGR